MYHETYASCRRKASARAASFVLLCLGNAIEPVHAFSGCHLSLSSLHQQQQHVGVFQRNFYRNPRYSTILLSSPDKGYHFWRYELPYSRRKVSPTYQCLKKKDVNFDEEFIIDAVVEAITHQNDETKINKGNSQQSRALASTSRSNDSMNKDDMKKRDVIKNVILRLTNLSLRDYQWRSSIFKRNEADRRLEESMAKLRGDSPSYVRPMDATDDKIGPLGKAEKHAVAWLSQVIEAEAKRAEKITKGDGRLVRPIDVDGGYDGGPLAELEQRAVNFLKLVADSETARASSGTIRPMNLEEAKRGPLGEAEAKLVSALEEVKAAERLRMQQSRNRGGEIVRPIDVPGPLGEIEKAVLAIVTSERRRAEERYKRNGGGFVRPMNAEVVGPLGAIERELSNAVERVKEEEKERLRNVQKWLGENRPMEKSRYSILGWTESFTVGLAKSPQMIMTVIERIRELIENDRLSKEDEAVLKKYLPSPKRGGREGDSSISPENST